MKKLFLIAALIAVQSHAEDEKIYRCGSEYTNTVTPAQAKSCKLVTPAELTPAEKADYQKCRMEAAKAPTEMGVRVAIAVCNERVKKE